MEGRKNAALHHAVRSLAVTKFLGGVSIVGFVCWSAFHLSCFFFFFSLGPYYSTDAEDKVQGNRLKIK